MLSYGEFAQVSPAGNSPAKGWHNCHPFRIRTCRCLLTLSGILFVGDTAVQRYVLHQHLMNMGLAGPPAPILHWAGHFRIGSYDTQVLPFRSLAELPAELLAIPVPTTSWAFEERPVMSLYEWEELRRRSTSTVLLTTDESSLSRAYHLLLEESGKLVPLFVSLWQLLWLLL